MPSIKTIVGTFIAIAVLLCGGVTAVAARGGGFHGGGGQGLVGYGTLTTISANSITVATPGNTSLTATLDPQATYTARSQAAAVAGLKSGNHVALRGRSVNGVVTVRAVDFDATAFAAAILRYTGTVSSSTANSLTITAGGQTVTVQLNADTQYVVNGSLTSTRPTFAANQRVRVEAAQMTNGNLVARIVSVATA